jgi:capsular polysaccharide transport system permease protein
MKKRILSLPAVGKARAWAAAVSSRIPPVIRNSRIWSLALVSILLAGIYWGLVASERYVSEAHVVVDRTDVGGGQTLDFTSLIAGSGNDRDQMLLRGYLLSSDMAERMDARLQLRAHWSDWHKDPLSRLWFREGPKEWYHNHFTSRVDAEVDESSGLLIIRAQAYTPEMAQALARALVEEGERFMNVLAHDLAREQVHFLEKEVARMEGRLGDARAAVVRFQDSRGYVSQASVEGLSGIVNQLEGELSKLRAQLTSMQGYLSDSAPDVVKLKLQIGGLEKQLSRERSRLVSPDGKALNSVTVEFQRLQMEAEFALETYRSALVALEKGRVDATRTMKKVSVVQAPALPDYPLEPRRIYNFVLFTLLVLLTAGISRLIAAVVRDHKD